MTKSKADSGGHPADIRPRQSVRSADSRGMSAPLGADTRVRPDAPPAIPAYNMVASRDLMSALGEIFGDQRFDEYSILNHARKLPLEFLNSRKQRQRVCIAHWLRWAADRNIGIIRDRDNSTWFRVLPVTRGGRGIAERDSNLTKSIYRSPVK